MAHPDLTSPPAQASPPPARPGGTSIPLPFVYAVFLLSGFAALIYQVVWQRSLYVLYGVNIESVTIVVTAFLIGLGLGSFAGGVLSEDPRRPLLGWFGAIELGIGAYGLASLQIFHAIGDFTAGSGPLAVFGLTFVLVLLPTSLMGATLPLLVAVTVRRSGNVGKSVGMLYFTNTLGSALASFATAVLLLGKLGQAKTVWLAAACNAIVGVSVLIAWLRDRRSAGAGTHLQEAA